MQPEYEEVNNESIEIEVLPHQIEFIKSEALHTGLVAGFGSGKSIAGTIKTIEKKKQYPGVDVAYYLPTYGLIKDIAFGNFKEWLTKMEIPFHLNESDKEFTTPLGKIILRSMDNPATIIGYEVGYSLIDEADILPIDKMKAVFLRIVARNRVYLPDGKQNSIDLVSTPEGFNFLYDFFVRNYKNNRKLIKAKTIDNPYLPPTYIETLKDTLTIEQFEAYTNGEFVNLTQGTVHYKYSRILNHTDREIEPYDKLHIGMDFNVTNMSGIIHVIDNGKPRAVDEITGAYDTPEMISIIKERFSKHTVVVYPDASGENRNSAGGPTDIKLLKRAGFIVIVGESNPPVKSRVNAMNSAFENAKGERSYLVNENNCPVYAEALEQQVYKNGVPDKTSGHDHKNEAAGYFIYNMNKKKTTRMSANV